MEHLNEQELIFYYYGEVSDPQTLAEHLDVCEPCHNRYQALQSVLGSLATAPVPDRSEDYGSHVWQRLRPHLPEGARSRWPSFSPLPRWVAATAMALMVLAAFLAGRLWTRLERQPVESVPLQARQRILLMEIGQHLERSQRALIQLLNAEADGLTDISYEQASARDLVTANRIYRQTANEFGETGVASVLDELERTLLEISHSPPKLSASQLSEMCHQIDRQGIVFKVRVIGGQMRARERQTSQAQGRVRSWFSRKI
jgi:hypothetical protein